MDRQTTSGNLFAFGAALALSSSFIFSKSALNEVTMIQFGAAWFSMGVIWNGVWFVLRGKQKGSNGALKPRLAVASGIALLEALATGLFYMAIRAMENPAIVSFIGNIGPVFVTIMGVTLLKERFRGRQFVGIIVTIAGVFVINFRDGAFTGFLDPGSMYVILASLFFSFATIGGRKYKANLDPELMSFIRSSMLAAAFIALFIIQDQSPVLPVSAWKDLALGSFFETLLTIVFAYQALRRITATSTSLIISSKAVWTLLLAWLFLGVFPSTVQLAGGVLTLAGVYLITWNSRSRG